jgi:tetratricopeptide (TPR) repeat protein
MNFKNFILVWLAALGLLITSGCKTITPHSDNKSGRQKDGFLWNEAGNFKIETTLKPEVEDRAEALARYANALRFEIKNDLTNALENYIQSALKDPSNDELVINVVNILINRKETNRAYQILEKACQKKDASHNVRERFGYIQLLNGKTNEAIHVFESILKEVPDHPRASQNLAFIYLQQKNKNKAKKILINLIESKNIKLDNRLEAADSVANIIQLDAELKTNLLPALTNLLESLKIGFPRTRETSPITLKLAEIYEKAGLFQEAADLYKELYSYFSDNAQMRVAVREKLMNLYILSGNRTNAIQQVKAIIAEQPTNPNAYYYLGSLYYEIKDYDKAAEVLQRALVLNPDFEPAYYDIAGAYINANKPDEALKYLNRARERFQKRRFILEFYTGIAYARKKDYKSSLKALTEAEIIAKAYETNRLTTPFYFQLGATFERYGDYKTAEKYFDKCLSLDPNFSEALNYLGYMWADLNINLNKAKVLIEKALKLEPDNSAYLDSLGWVYFRQKKFNKALQYLEKAAKLSKEPDATIFEHLGDVYYELKQWGKARDYWKKSLEIESNPKVEEKLRKLQEKNPK